MEQCSQTFLSLGRKETIVDHDFEWLMIDASYVKVHMHAAGAVGGNQDMERTKGGLTPQYIWPWIYAWYADQNIYYGRYRPLL